MSKEEFEAYLALVSSLLQLTPDQREQIGDELYDHLENRVAELVGRGVERDDAVVQAVEEFGDASALAKNLKEVSSNNRKRWMMRFATLCTAAAFLVGVFTMAMWPEQARFGTPSKTVAQEESSDDPFGTAGNEGAGDPFAGSKAPTVPVGDVTSPSTTTLTNDGVRKKLLAICKLGFDEDSYMDFEAKLEKELGVSVILTPSAYDDQLSWDETITWSPAEITYASALRILLSQKNATYCIQDGVIKIISLDDTDNPRYFARRMINVNETLQLVRAIEKDRIGKPKPGSTNGGAGGGFGGGLGGGGGGGGGVFAIQAAGAAPVNQAVDAKEIQQLADAIVQAVKNSQPKVRYPLPVVTAESMLVDAIQESVANDEWYNSGGNANITCLGGVLIVNAPESVNEKVESFVEDLTFNIKAAAAKRR